MVWAIVAMAAADVTLTAYGLHLGVFVEANPLLVAGLHLLGGWVWLPTLAVSVGAPLMIWRLGGRAHPSWRWLPVVGMWVAFVARVGVMALHGYWLAHVFVMAR